jgi:hypothetical protein
MIGYRCTWSSTTSTASARAASRCARSKRPDLLEPGGFLYLAEGHPFAQILDYEQGRTVAQDYFDERPQVEDYPYSHTGGPALEHAATFSFSIRSGL